MTGRQLRKALITTGRCYKWAIEPAKKGPRRYWFALPLRWRVKGRLKHWHRIDFLPINKV